jgi:hypothetical protein
MRRARLLAVAAAVFLCVPELTRAQDLTTVGDLDLLAKTREAVEAQDADAALQLLTEMQRRGVGIFAGQGASKCEEVINLPDGITDWKFHAVVRQAYIRTAMSRQLAVKSCGCMFEGFSFDDFVSATLGKPAADLNDEDSAELKDIRDLDRRETEAQYRELAKSCRAN